MHRSILVIIQRSNGDVFLSSALIEALKTAYLEAKIDILVNKDTEAIAKSLPHIESIYTYDYTWKKEGLFKRVSNELNLIRKLFGRYDLAINLTASDRSVLYARLFGKTAISCIEPESKKSWWKKMLLSKHFIYDPSRHIVEHTIMPAKLLGIEPPQKVVRTAVSKKGEKELKSLPLDTSKPFIIFHPSAQYDYKIYPKHLRDELLKLLSTLDIPIAVTGGKSKIDLQISKSLPDLPNLINLIGKTTLEGYIALCAASKGYIGMDTLNMHIAAALNKPIFAIFGPTLPQVWSPWCNTLQRGADRSAPLQHYGNVTLFQADMECVACGKAGCDDRHGRSDCLYAIEPQRVFNEVDRWLKKSA